MLETMTVEEVIAMSAKLRLPQNLPKATVEQHIRETLTSLRLENAAKTRIAGVSGGERKRAGIAMELITKPQVLFLDEPTSGLDSFTAFVIVQVLKTFAHNHGSAVIATIHQPSSDIFHLFDELILLNAGEVVYAGSSSAAVAYFESLGFRFPSLTNPADYIFMHVLNEELRESPDESTNNLKNINLAQSWKQSTQYQEMVGHLGSMPTIPEPASKKRRAHIIASFRAQFLFLFHRASINALRNELVIRVRLFQSLFIGVLAGLVFINATSGTIAGQIQSISGFLYFLPVNQFFASATSVLSIFAMEKRVFIREYAAGYYSLPAYYLSKVLVELPHQLVFPALLLVIAYYIVGLKAEFSAYLLDALLLGLCAVCGNAVGILVAACVDEVAMALAILPVFILPVLLFSGLFVNSGNFPAWLGWLQWISPVRYAFSSMIVNQFTSYTFANCLPTDQPQCQGERAIEQLGFAHDLPIGVNISLMIAIYLALILGAYLALWGKSR